MKHIIVRTAADVFSSLGFKQTTMDDIAHRVNKAKSSIYYYFHSKEEMYHYIITEEQREFHSELLRSVENADQPVNKLKAFLTTRIEELKRFKNIRHVLNNNEIEESNFIQEIREDQEQKEEAVIHQILEEGIAKGYFAVNSIEHTVNAIMVTLHGLDQAQNIRARIQDIKNQIDSVLNLILSGISSTPQLRAQNG